MSREGTCRIEVKGWGWIDSRQQMWNDAQVSCWEALYLIQNGKRARFFWLLVSPRTETQVLHGEGATGIRCNLAKDLETLIQCLWKQSGYMWRQCQAIRVLLSTLVLLLEANKATSQQVSRKQKNTQEVKKTNWTLLFSSDAVEVEICLQITSFFPPVRAVNEQLGRGSARFSHFLVNTVIWVFCGLHSVNSREPLLVQTRRRAKSHRSGDDNSLWTRECSLFSAGRLRPPQLQTLPEQILRRNHAQPSMFFSD